MVRSLGKRRIQFSIASLLLTALVVAIVANIIRPYFLTPPKWHEFSVGDLERELDRGRTVVVYFRDDWSSGFDDSEPVLLNGELTYALNKNNAIIMIANRTLSNAKTETELRRISDSNEIPAVAVYSPDKSVKLLEHPIKLKNLVRRLNESR